jgi:phage gp46-like protein
MTDVRLFHQDDGGNIEFAGPHEPTTDIKLDTGLETAVYLSWFGGSERDPGARHTADDADADHEHKHQWWGNYGEPEARQMISETGHMIRSLPATSNNLLLIESSMMRDVQWMLDDGTASEVFVTASLVAKDRIGVSARIIINKEEFVVAFESSWGE